MFALKTILGVFVCTSLTALLLAGCGGGSSNEVVDNPTPITPVPDKTPDNTRRLDELSISLSKLRGDIDGIVGEAQYCYSDENCTNLALGELSQGCGDADTYLSYAPASLRHGAPQYLQDLIAEYNTLDKERDTLLSSGLVSPAVCLENSPPSVRCVYQKCTNDQSQIQAFERYYRQLQADWERLSEEINTLVGSAQCTTALDCRSIGFGHKPCGGPDSFLTYSVLVTDPQQLTPKVNEFNKLAQTFNSLHGYASLSTCDVVMPQPVECVRNQCKEAELAKLETELATVDAEIKAMIGQAQCTSSLDCRLLDVISLPVCGGFSSFHAAYSVIETNKDALLVTYEQRREVIRKISSFQTSQNVPSVVSPSDGASCLTMSHNPVAQCINNKCRGIYSPIVSMGNNAGVTWEEVKTMIGDPVCSSAEQCGVWQVGYSLTGESPPLCGEDTTFAYSTFVTDPKEIAEKVGQYAQSVAANYNAQGSNAVCQSSVSFTDGVCRNEKCWAN